MPADQRLEYEWLRVQYQSKPYSGPRKLASYAALTETRPRQGKGARFCTQADDGKTLFRLTYEADRKWCESSGENPMKKKTIKEGLIERGFDCRPGKGDQVFVNGLSLNRVI